MGEINSTSISGLVINGMKGDYVFETINSKNAFYEDSILNKWLPFIKDSKVIFDIGANLGNHTLFWATNVAYEKIFSFEPHPVNFELLTRNISNNSLENVSAVNTGIGDKKGFTSVKEFSEDNYGATTLDTTIQPDGDIPIIDIDSYVEQENISGVDFIKVDTEGYEESVLAGMPNVLAKYHPDLWIEVSSESFQNVLSLLQEMGYVLADVDGFNMLFLYTGRHPEIQEVEKETLLRDVFYNLTRVNVYYKNYMTAKKWLADKDVKFQAKSEVLVNRLVECLNDYDESIKNLEKLKREISALEVRNQALMQTNKEQKQKLDMIRNSRIGRLGIRLYHFYRRVFRR